MLFASKYLLLSFFVDSLSYTYENKFAELYFERIRYFTDNGERKALYDLRQKDIYSLSDEEKAVLEASNWIGFIHLPGCKRGGNATLVNINGRDAVVTHNHLVWDNRYSLRWLVCDSDEKAWYYPNAAYLNQTFEVPSADSFIMKKVALLPDPINFETWQTDKGMKDFLFFFLEEQISQEILPAPMHNQDKPRGFMRWSTKWESNGRIWNIGFDGRFEKENGRQMSYMECDFEQNPIQIYFIFVTCDVSKGSSGSALGTIEDGEMTLQGIMSTSSSGEFLGYEDIPVPGSLLWNYGVSSFNMLKVLEEFFEKTE